MLFLRQSTAVDIAIGPFLDSTDGVTAETGLTISQADVRLKKNNGAWAQVNDNTAATHEENGFYEKELDATDTNTVGILIVAVHESGALPVWHEFQVVEEAVYDMLFASSALGYIANAPVNVAQFGGSNGTFASGRPEVNTTHWGGTAVASAVVPANTIQISGDATAADNLETVLDDTAGAVPWTGIVDQGTAQSATATTLVLRAATPFGANDVPIGMTLAVLGSDQGYWQTRVITDYVTASDTATVATWTVTPSGTITYKIFATAPASSSGSGATAQEVWEYATRELTALDEDNTTIDINAAVTAAVPTAAAIADAVWDEATTGHTTSGTFGEQVKTDIDEILTDTGTTLQGELDGIQADTEDIQSRLPAALVSGRIDASVGAMANNVMTAAAAAADLTTELQSGLATAANLATVDTVVDAIKAVTDLLPDAGALTSLATAANLATVDTVVDAIKAKTDSLTFTVAGQVDANIQSINDVTITGDGAPGTEFGV